MKTPQADGSSAPLDEVEKPTPPPKSPAPQTAPDAGDKHIGATEDQVSDTSPPAGEAFEDEPKQG